MAAIRGNQGERTIYQVLVENAVLNNFFTVNMDPPTEKSQRQLDPKHAAAIGQYIINNPDEYVLGTVTYAVDTECAFEPSEIDDRLGVLTIPLGTNLRSLDGQHRRQGLNQAIDADPAFSNDHTSVLIYVEPDVEKRRQMFSDMNATPKIVAKSLNVAFNSRDPFARVARTLADTHPLLTEHVDKESRQVQGTSQFWYTIGAVHDSLKRLERGPGGRVRNAAQYDEDAIRKTGTDFFDLLNNARDEYSRVRDGENIANLRSKTVLFSSTTLRAIAGAVHDAIEAESSPTKATAYVGQMRAIDFSPSAEVWRKTGFVTPGRSTPNARNQEVIAATKAITKMLRGEDWR